MASSLPGGNKAFSRLIATEESTFSTSPVASQQPEQLVAAIRAADTGGLLRDAMLFDVYKPKQSSAAIAAGEKSMAVRLTLADPDATLTDPQIEAAVASVVALLQERLGARLRG